jgi:hypothetical protein
LYEFAKLGSGCCSISRHLMSGGLSHYYAATVTRCDLSKQVANFSDQFGVARPEATALVD